MKSSAALLIDLENFYLSRIDHFNDAGVRVEDRPALADDLRNLVRGAQAVAKTPFAVRRAYADFDALKVNPRELMGQGIEPVQVFRLSGRTGNKNAADMKLAMDAVSLDAGGGPVEHFVLVSGDADFIPVILELKRRGHTVSVIAVTGATNEFIQRFADHFELFETRHPLAAKKAAREAPETPPDLAPVAAALVRVLAHARPLRLNLVQPRLSKELGYVFAASAFGCVSTGEFLRRHHAALGVVVRGAQNDQEIDLPAAAAVAPPPPARPRPPAGGLHTAAAYRKLLQNGGPKGSGDTEHMRVLPVPWPSVERVCADTFARLAPAAGGGPMPRDELLARLYESDAEARVPKYDTHVRRAVALFGLANALLEADGRVGLHPEVADAGDIRWAALGVTLRLLAVRLEEERAWPNRSAPRRSSPPSKRGRSPARWFPKSPAPSPRCTSRPWCWNCPRMRPHPPPAGRPPR